MDDTTAREDDSGEGEQTIRAELGEVVEVLREWRSRLARRLRHARRRLVIHARVAVTD